LVCAAAEPGPPPLTAHDRIAAEASFCHRFIVALSFLRPIDRGKRV
jgi:hypothetical protein